jgi:hypothetical protein
MSPFISSGRAGRISPGVSGDTNDSYYFARFRPTRPCLSSPRASESLNERRERTGERSGRRRFGVGSLPVRPHPPSPHPEKLRAVQPFIERAERLLLPPSEDRRVPSGIQCVDDRADPSLAISSPRPCRPT